MQRVETESGLSALTPYVETLADAINIVTDRHGYFGAFAGELNFSLHTIHLRTFPKINPALPWGMKYVRASHFAGWLEDVIDIFGDFNVEAVSAAYSKKRTSLDGIRPELRLAYVTAWAFVEVCARVAPDNSVETRHLIRGVLRHIGTEFYRRAVARYEDKQIAHPNRGDLPEYTELNGDIDKV